MNQSSFDAFQFSVEILVRTDHQQFKRVLINDSVGEQAKQVANAELVNLNAR
jgi:hypothetical protein